MGQAAVDLPDPLDTPAPATLAGTDDLLAQIAGDEIDRLIAESEDERAPFAPPPPRPSAAPDAAADSPDSRANAVAGPARSAAVALTDPGAAASPPPAAKAPQPAPAAHVAPPAMPVDAIDDDEGSTSAADDAPEDGAAAEDDLPTLSPAALEADAELDKLLEEMSRAEREAEAPAPSPALVASAAEAPPAPGAAAATGAGAAPTADMLMSPEERDALSLSGIDDEAAAAEARDAAAAVQGQREPLPVVVLEMINAPLSFVPDRLRDALGKIAILTLVNSLAVLIYVLFIRQ